MTSDVGHNWKGEVKNGLKWIYITVIHISTMLGTIYSWRSREPKRLSNCRVWTIFGWRKKRSWLFKKVIHWGFVANVSTQICHDNFANTPICENMVKRSVRSCCLGVFCFFPFSIDSLKVSSFQDILLVSFFIVDHEFFLAGISE